MTETDVRGFDQIVRRFADDLSRPDYRSQARRNKALFVKMRRRGLFVREDPMREWEHSHVALQLKATMAPGSKIVDFGGGGSILCYELASAGYDVTVIEVDARICRIINANASRLGLGATLRAIPHDGRAPWPVADVDIDAVACVSVFESLLRRQRAAFFAECRRVLKRGGEFLLTFDFGDGARLVGDPPCSVEEMRSHIVEPSGLTLAGAIPSAPQFSADVPPPVRLAVIDVDGYDSATAAYTFAALRFVQDREPARNPRPVVADARMQIDAHLDPKAVAEEVLRQVAADGRLPDLAPLAASFELWEDSGDSRWFWEITARGARQVDGTVRPADCVLAGTRRALGDLLRWPDTFWALHYDGEFAPRGDLSAALRLVDLFPTGA